MVVSKVKAVGKYMWGTHIPLHGGHSHEILILNAQQILQRTDCSLGTCHRERSHLAVGFSHCATLPAETEKPKNSCMEIGSNDEPNTK